VDVVGALNPQHVWLAVTVVLLLPWAPAMHLNGHLKMVFALQVLTMYVHSIVTVAHVSLKIMPHVRGAHPLEVVWLKIEAVTSAHGVGSLMFVWVHVNETR
jgi:hypothetical protein